MLDLGDPMQGEGGKYTNETGTFAPKTTKHIWIFYIKMTKQKKSLS